MTNRQRITLMARFCDNGLNSYVITQLRCGSVAYTAFMRRLPTVICAGLLASGIASSPAFAGSGSTGVSNKVFRQSLKQILPLSAAQIRALRRQTNITHQAMHATRPPRLQSSSQVLDLSPGAPLPTVWVAPNYVSSLVFVGSDGSPWPITSFTIGAPKWFTVTDPKVKPGSMLTVAPLADYVSSDLVVTLEGRATPVVLQLETSHKQAAVLTELRANRPGPGAASVVFSSSDHIAPVVDGTMLAFLEDAPPKGAANLITKASGIEAWRYHHRLYVRTRYTAVWPAWMAHARGAGGVSIYRMPVVSSLLLSIGGHTHTIDLNNADNDHG